MKIKYLLLFVIFNNFLSLFSKAQSHAGNVYVEIGGPGVAAINYDMRFKKKEDGLGFRAGIGGFTVDGSSALFVPLGLNYLIGKDEKNYFEIGTGLTIVSAKESFGNSDGSDFNATFGHLYFGYRLQPKRGGFLFRAGITPIFGKGFFVPYYAGISFGYKF